MHTYDVKIKELDYVKEGLQGDKRTYLTKLTLDMGGPYEWKCDLPGRRALLIIFDDGTRPEGL